MYCDFKTNRLFLPGKNIDDIGKRPTEAAAKEEDKEERKQKLHKYLSMLMAERNQSEDAIAA